MSASSADAAPSITKLVSASACTAAAYIVAICQSTYAVELCTHRAATHSKTGTSLCNTLKAPCALLVDESSLKFCFSLKQQELLTDNEFMRSHTFVKDISLIESRHSICFKHETDQLRTQIYTKSAPQLDKCNDLDHVPQAQRTLRSREARQPTWGTRNPPAVRPA